MLIEMPKETSPPSIRLVIIDNHTMVRRGVAVFIKGNPDFELVGEGSSVKEGLALCKKFKPDVALIDLMPMKNSIIATREITNLYPDTKVLVMTGFTDQQLIQDVIKDVLEAGAMGYVLKKVSGTALVNAIRAAHHGISTYSPEVIDMLAKSAETYPYDDVDKATRERVVLRLDSQRYG